MTEGRTQRRKTDPNDEDRTQRVETNGRGQSPTTRLWSQRIEPLMRWIDDKVIRWMKDGVRPMARHWTKSLEAYWSWALSAELPALLSCFFFFSNSFHVPIHEPKGIVSPWVKVIYWQEDGGERRKKGGKFKHGRSRIYTPDVVLTNPQIKWNASNLSRTPICTANAQRKRIYMLIRWTWNHTRDLYSDS